MEKIKYPVYDYIKFIWKKKLLLIGFTILCMVIGAGFSYTKETVYTSTALVFTGNANNDELSKPDLIIAKYKKELPNALQNTLNVQADPFQITFTLSGNDKETVESAMKKLAEQYEKDLMIEFNDQYGSLKDYVNALVKVVNQTEEAVSKYNQLLETSDEDKLFNYTAVLISKMDSEYKADLLEAKDLLSSAEPPIYNNEVTTTQTSNNLLRNTILAGAFGFQLMLVLLVLWKYIINARRALSERK
ncbi:Wzz/FepE/Etk N-terminal domain-containing protein [Cytobacillus firmus]|uniref:Wzz/FepE/Etk N-terminal domain-containing protein n=1 Tax=Cytobacillus firmus TaxID=1399 RepID=UPI00202FC23F|nr:Wzz/FepE/Etk N-terminal domain-containing protein [Cytobacillus firmus]URT70552.1 Wzz/FepE/Etk N-terminal domain-containing protein [Cytobacillus firmus]